MTGMRKYARDTRDLVIGGSLMLVLLGLRLALKVRRYGAGA